MLFKKQPAQNFTIESIYPLPFGEVLSDEVTLCYLRLKE